MGPTKSIHLRPGRRTWVAIFLLLTIAGTFAAFEKLPRTYQSEASVVLLASRWTARPNGGNPYLSFTPSLTLTADVLSTELMAPDSVQSLTSQGFSGSYTVALAPYSTQTTGSVLIVTATGSGKAIAQGTLFAVTNEIHAKLTELQAGIARRDRVQIRTLSATRQATVSVGHLVRSLAMVMVLGLAITFGVPRAVDTQIAGRRARRAARPAAAAPYPASPVDDRSWDITSAAAGRSPAGASAGSGNGAGPGTRTGSGSTASSAAASGTNRPA